MIQQFFNFIKELNQAGLFTQDYGYYLHNGSTQIILNISRLYMAWELELAETNETPPPKHELNEALTLHPAYVDYSDESGAPFRYIFGSGKYKQHAYGLVFNLNKLELNLDNEQKAIEE